MAQVSRSFAVQTAKICGDTVRGTGVQVALETLETRENVQQCVWVGLWFETNIVTGNGTAALFYIPSLEQIVIRLISALL